MLNDKVIVVVGGSGLLGQAIVKSIIQHQGTPIIADINPPDKLTDVHMDYMYLDITSKNSINKCISDIVQKYSKIDGVVISAYPRNKNYGKKFEEVNYEDFCENVNLHLGGYFLVAQQFALFFEKQGFGNIIFLSSIYGVVPPRFEIYEGTNMTMPVEYACIKSAIIHLAKYMAKYFKGKNIRVNCVSPGGIIDNQPESFVQSYKKYCLNKGMLNTEDVAGTLIFLLSDGSMYINGQNIIVDDGFSL